MNPTNSASPTAAMNPATTLHPTPSVPTIDLASFASPADLAGLATADPAAVLAVLTDPAYWRQIVRETAGASLTISAAGPSESTWGPDTSEPLSTGEQRRARAEVTRDGYTGLPGFLDADRSAALAAASLALLERGWPATFLMLFDEPWLLARHLARAMQSAVHDEVALRYEMFVYCVDSTRPQARSRGIPPHRDAPGAGFDARGDWSLPRHCTAWLALTDTDVDNGCIYVIPAGTETDAEREAPICEERGVPLEVPAGTLLLWGGHVAHWGGRHDAARARGPRVAITCVASVEPTWGLPPLDLPTDPSSAALPDLATRLSFVAALLRGFGPPAPGSAVARILDVLPRLPAEQEPPHLPCYVWHNRLNVFGDGHR